MDFYIKKLSDFFFLAFSMDTAASEEKCERKNDKTTLPVAFSAKTKVAVVVRLLREHEGDGGGDGCSAKTKGYCD